MAWKGNIQNPAPNSAQEPINRSEKIIADNRAEQVRRDNDEQKDFTVKLMDIDEVIARHLEQLQLQVVAAGKVVKVPIFHGSPERWVSAQKDGYMRDKQGKVLLPAIIFKRTSSENDTTLPFFNRYLNTQVIKMYSPKNKYTQFSQLAGQNAPVNEVYNVIIPSHMLLTYHFVVWTDSVEQMNGLIETIQFNTRDYWGTKQGFKFRTKIESYSHTVEIEANEDRIVKTEFDLVTHGYIIPDSMTKLEKHQMTSTKMFTPKKIIIGSEVVSTGQDVPASNNREKWRNPNYPNLQADVNIPSPPITVTDGTSDTSIASHILTTLTNATSTSTVSTVGGGVDDASPYLKIVPVPTNITTAVGQEGYVSYDKNYFYIYSAGSWRRVAISQFS